MKKTVIWLDNYLEEFFMVISLILMTVIMGIQVFSRYVLGSAPSWSEEITRYLFVWSGFLSVAIAQKNVFPLRSNSLCQFSHEEGRHFLNWSTIPLN